MTMRTSKERVIQRLETVWADFQESFAGLSEQQMLEPGVTGDWSVKDLIAHVSWWEEETLSHLPEILAGVRPQRYLVLYGGIDAFNAMMTEKWRHLPLTAVIERANTTHQQLMAFLSGIPGEQFASETKFRKRLRLDTYGHYPIHARAIRVWRGSRF